MKAIIISISELQKYGGRLDPKFWVVVNEHKEKIEELENDYSPDEIDAMLQKAPPPLWDCLRPLVTGVNPFKSEDELKRLMKNHPVLCLAIMLDNTDKLRGFIQQGIEAAKCLIDQVDRFKISE